MTARSSGRRAASESLRSWGETQLSRLLKRSGIEYFYEQPLAVLDDGKVRIWYPDFQLPRYGIVIEYFGMTGDHAYAERMKKKQAVYEANSLAVLLLTADVFRGNWPQRVLSQIEEILVKRLEEFRACMGEVRSGSYGAPVGAGD